MILRRQSSSRFLRSAGVPSRSFPFLPVPSHSTEAFRHTMPHTAHTVSIDDVRVPALSTPQPLLSSNPSLSYQPITSFTTLNSTRGSSYPNRHPTVGSSCFSSPPISLASTTPHTPLNIYAASARSIPPARSDRVQPLNPPLIAMRDSESPGSSRPSAPATPTTPTPTATPGQQGDRHARLPKGAGGVAQDPHASTTSTVPRPLPPAEPPPSLAPSIGDDGPSRISVPACITARRC